jgi:hypothetical protein
VAVVVNRRGRSERRDGAEKMAGRKENGKQSLNTAIARMHVQAERMLAG